MFKKCIFIIPVLAVYYCLLTGQSDAQVYSTWDTIEPDKCASAWLLKRFVNREATFTFYPNGELISSGIPFDTPEAELRRYHNMSTFESILRKYKLNDTQLVEMGKILHDIEVNSWGKKLRKESERVEIAIRKIVKDYNDPNEILEKSFEYFDKFYEGLKRSYHEHYQDKQ